MAHIDGVKFFYYSQAIRITDDVVTCVTVEKIVSDDGSVNFEENFLSSFDVEADSVIIAIGQGPGADIISGNRFKFSDQFGSDKQNRLRARRIWRCRKRFLQYRSKISNL